MISIDEINELVEQLDSVKSELIKCKALAVEYEKSLEIYLEKYSNCMTTLDNIKELCLCNDSKETVPDFQKKVLSEIKKLKV